jgi:hypothetical protein
MTRTGLTSLAEFDVRQARRLSCRGRFTLFNRVFTEETGITPASSGAKSWPIPEFGQPQAGACRLRRDSSLAKRDRLVHRGQGPSM